MNAQVKAPSDMISEHVKSFAIPSGIATKKLSMKVSPTTGKKKIAVSTNWLPLFGFEAGAEVIERSLGANKGIEIILLSDLDSFVGNTLDLFNPEDVKLKKKIVYQREYKARKNNPLETLIEVASQKIIDDSFPCDTTRVHVTFSQSRITITPLTTFQEDALKNITPESKHEVFAACTSGVDLHSLENTHGMSIHSVIDWRAVEARDGKRDLTETGAVSVLRNVKSIRNLFNEDITYIDASRLEAAVKDSPVTTFMASPVCDDFTNVKNNTAKEDSIENLTTSLDQSFDMLRCIYAIKPPVVCFEQVRGWYKSDAYKVLSIRLRKLGYKENVLIADPRDYGGTTSRVRGYGVFTVLDAPFEFEDKTQRSDETIWGLVQNHLPECRDVSHSKSINDGKACGRLRIINKDSLHSPTFLKSQPRMAKDSVVIEDEGKFYWPSEDLQKSLMGILPTFTTDAVSKDIGSEILGQSIDGAVHDSVIRSLKKHIDLHQPA